MFGRNMLGRTVELVEPNAELGHPDRWRRLSAHQLPVKLKVCLELCPLGGVQEVG